MLKSLFSAVSGLKSHQTMMDVIGNNIANVNTTGYKSSSTQFTDIYYQTLAAASKPTDDLGGTNPTQVGAGATVSAINVSTGRGGYQQTYETLDMYISGEGYFVVQDGDGNTKYTRVGSLDFDAAGNLVDANGSFICGGMPSYTAGSDAAPITIADFANYTGLSIGSDGTITGVNSTSGEEESLGQIALATFANPGGLTQQGNCYVTESANSGTPALYAPGDDMVGALVSGGLEMSNVDLASEFTNMIIAQRGFQANSRVITTSDSILEELVNLKR